jgi:diguanylate cyclase (GGDEF)-like protein
VSDITSASAPSSTPTCPVGETRCRVIDELITVREKVSELTEQAHTDTLTGLANYRYFCRILDNEMERTQRTGQPTAMIIIDLDFFKKVNDTYGHEVGNQALIQTSRILKDGVRKLDVPCRYGGEEFTVVLPSTNLLTGLQVAERLRKMIEATPLFADNQEIKLTASMGVNTHTRSDNKDTREAFIARTDELLYQAKESGRNKVCAGIQTDLQPKTIVTSDEKDALFGLFDSPQEP